MVEDGHLFHIYQGYVRTIITQCTYIMLEVPSLRADHRYVVQIIKISDNPCEAYPVIR